MLITSSNILIREEGISNFIKKLFFYEDLIGKEKIIELVKNNSRIILNLLDMSLILEETNILKKQKAPSTSRLVTEKGFFQIVTLIYKFKDVLPESDFQKVLSSNTDFFFNLLDDTDDNFCYTDSLVQTNKEESIANWSENNYLQYFESLSLTPIQRMLLKGILSKDNIPLTNLEKFLQKNDIKVKSGSMIGGSLAGVTKKCLSYKVPQIFIIKKGMGNSNSPTNESYYSIAPSAKKFLTKYLDNHLP